MVKPMYKLINYAKCMVTILRDKIHDPCTWYMVTFNCGSSNRHELLQEPSFAVSRGHYLHSCFLACYIMGTLLSKLAFNVAFRHESPCVKSSITGWILPQILSTYFYGYSRTHARGNHLHCAAVTARLPRSLWGRLCEFHLLNKIIS